MPLLISAVSSSPTAYMRRFYPDGGRLPQQKIPLTSLFRHFVEYMMEQLRYLVSSALITVYDDGGGWVSLEPLEAVRQPQ